MRKPENYVPVSLFLFTLILFTGLHCRKIENPSAPERDSSHLAKSSIQTSKSGCLTPPSGLINWWPGDGNTNDIQGNNNGTLQNDATFELGLVGQAFSFDGDGDFVSLP